MFKKLKKLLIYENDSTQDLKKVRSQIMEENRSFAIIWAAFQMVYWAYCLFMSTREPDFMLCRSIYAVSFAICTAALVLAVFFVPKAEWLVQPIAFIIDAAFLGAGIAIAQHLAPKTIIIFASVLVVPVFFICDSISTLIILSANIAAFAITGMERMEYETYHWTLVNLIIFSSIGFLLGYFVNKDRFERYYFSESAVRLAELQTRYAYYDQMTGLENRRAYAERIDTYVDKVPSGCCVIMADINGLKMMNDTYGHEAGDELIIGAAECLRNSFSDVGMVYRIGGDEFCVIMNGTEDDVKEHLKLLDQYGNQRKGKFFNSISLACGFATDREFDDFESMSKAADKRMYAAKSEYYKARGYDRRRR